jgi:hypothetical protein
MPSGAEKWFKFLSNFNKLIDLKVIATEREKQLEWVDGVVKSAHVNFQNNPIALRLNLQDLLKTNIALTKSIDQSTLINPEEVATEVNEVATTVRTTYRKNVETALAAIKSEALAQAAKVTRELYKLSEAALFHVTTSVKAPRVVGSISGHAEVLLGVPASGPIFCGDVPSLQNWIDTIFYCLSAALSHFLAGKPFKEELFADFLESIETAGMSGSSSGVTGPIEAIQRMLGERTISLDQEDIDGLLKTFGENFLDQYCVRTALDLCASYEPSKVLGSAVLCHFSTGTAAAASWAVEIVNPCVAADVDPYDGAALPPQRNSVFNGSSKAPFKEAAGAVEGGCNSPSANKEGNPAFFPNSPGGDSVQVVEDVPLKVEEETPNEFTNRRRIKVVQNVPAPDSSIGAGASAAAEAVGDAMAGAMKSVVKGTRRLSVQPLINIYANATASTKYTSPPLGGAAGVPPPPPPPPPAPVDV